MSGEPIRAQGLNVQRGGRPVLRDVSLEIAPGQITALLGPNGAGKSSLVLAIAGILPLESGSVELDGQELARRSPEEIRARGVAAVPEGHQVLTDLTMHENLLAAGTMLPPRELEHAVADALEIFPELQPKLHARAGNLSGGQQQMLALAQALVCRPKFLLADELSFGLAPLIVARLMRVIQDIAGRGVGVLLIEQFTTIALQLASHVYVLDRGVIRFDGTPDAIHADPGVLHAAYLAGDFHVAA